MRLGAAWLTWVALLLLCRIAPAQIQPPSEKLRINSKSAFIWSHAGTQIIQLEGPLTVTLDNATLTAQQAVVWLTPVPNAAPGQQHAEFSLFGDATVRQNIATRSGDQLYVTEEVLGDSQITADQRVARDMSETPFYRRAEELRRQAATRPRSPTDTMPTTPSTGPASRAARTATRPTEPGMPVHLEAGQTDVTDTEEGTVAIVAGSGVIVRVQQATGDYLTMQAQRAVLFTSMQSLRDMNAHDKADEGTRKVTAVYLEGDTRIEYMPTKTNMGQQRLRAERVYYELATDRAILLDAVVHTVLPRQQIPVIIRAKTVRQLSKEEFANQKVVLTSSAFAVPSYSIAADRLNVRVEATGDPQFPEVVEFQASNATFQAFNIPFFYLPYAAGSIGDRPGAMREIGFTERTDLGYSFLSDWGLFETLGQTPPRTLDAAYRLDYFGKRGPGFGVDAAYGGGFVTEDTRQPWNFKGDLKSYFVYDKGMDVDYGRVPVKPDGAADALRGRLLYEHQHFLPDDWQAQVRLGYVSDPTFLEEWFPRQFMQEGPDDESLYLKRQRDTEAFTVLVQAQPNRLITTSERMAEQFEVERFPEVAYRREGDSLANDSLTIFSDNTAGGLEFQPTRATLTQQGFRVPDILPGIAALGQTGVTKTITWRADFRQELDWPLDLGHFKVVPYLIGRYTEYSNSPSDQSQARFFGAAGVRISTTFWKTDPTAESDLFDIHQLRHVVEPTLNLFTSGTTADRSRLFLYDTPIDAINDLSAVDIGLHQRWQTQRGGPDRWRSVDVFSLDLDAAFFANKPATHNFRNPFDFRGVFFGSMPETSIPRDALNADASWRLTDNTVILADAQYNLNADKLATAGLGVLVLRDVTQSWYLGNRYIADLNSNITSIQLSYQVSPKYTLIVGQDFDFGLNKDVSSNVAVVRSFDRFMMIFRFSHDQIGNQTGFSFGIVPFGFNAGIGSDSLGPFRR